MTERISSFSSSSKEVRLKPYWINERTWSYHTVSKINKGRMAAFTDEGIVVFLIGMRINNVLAFHKWVPVFMAMGRMLPELYKNPQLGFKSYQMWFSRTLILVQYWESAEKLLEYARVLRSHQRVLAQ